MASLRLCISLDAYDSKKSTFCTNPPQFPVHSSLSSISSCTHLTRACILTPLGKFGPIKVSRIETELLCGNSEVGLVNQGGRVNLVDQGPVVEPETRNYKGGKKGTRREVGIKFSQKRRGREKERQDPFVHDGELDVNYSVVGPSLSLEQCNYILKRLESGSNDMKTLRFFEWMKSSGKLEKNVSAYNVVLRVLGRREDWDCAERIIRALSESLGDQLDARVFNTLLYTCSKRGRVELAGKWLQLMLDLGVRPTIATFGMLMGLYQKGWNLEEAELAFAYMRSFGIVCQSAYSAMITIYTRLSLYEKAEQVIGLMKEDKVVLNLENWLVLLNAYSQRGKLDEAEKVFVSMQEAGFPPNVIACNTLITGYGKVHNMVAAQHLFDRIRNVGLLPDETTYRSMIEGWGRAGNYKEANWYYKELKRLGFKPNSSNLYTLINLQAENGDEDGAIMTVDDMINMGCQYSSILGTVLKAYERAGRISRLPLLLNGSFYQHIMVSQTSCSILVMAYVKHCLIDDAMKVLRDKEWNDPVFEDNLYHLLICSCKELGYLENAVKIYEQIPNYDDKPNLHISCTMIDIYSIMGLFPEAEKTYLRLKSSGVGLDVIAFSIVIRMYAKAGSLKDACSILESMEKQQNIVPDICLYRDMLRIYHKCGMVNKLKDLYYKILKSGVVWDQELYNCLINCCARALPVDELSRLFDEMLQRGFAPNTVTFNVMLDVYGKSKFFKKAREVFRMARKRGLVDVISYNTIIASYGQSKKLSSMVSTVRRMQFDGFSISLEAYNCMLDAYGKQGQMENFRNILRRMKESSCASDHYTYNIIINIYAEQGWIADVAGVLTELREYGLRPDLCSYNTLIKAYGIGGMVEDAVGIIKEMRENGIEPDKITYTNLVTALQKNDKYLEAVKWSLWMKQMGL